MALYPVIRRLQHQRVVLASASPRRQEILSNAGLRFEVVPSRFRERLDKAAFAAPHAYAVETARQKALDVARRRHQKDLEAPDMVIGADTIVTLQGQILEKPADKQDAYRMLSRLNGKEHSVFTGVTVIRCSCQEDGRLDMEVSSFYEETRVKFSQLSEEMLWDYIHSGEPMDKAGGYGIQALGGMLVEYVRGDFLNVVGFPLNRFCKELAQLLLPAPPGDPLPARPAARDAASESPSDLSDAEGRARGGARGREGGGGRGRRSSGARRLVDSLPATPLLELLDGFKASKALLTACKMRVFDVLEDDAPLSAPEIARRIEASEDGTARLLDACAALGLLEKAGGGYSNSALASLYLPADAEFSLQPLLAYSDQHAWAFFSDLEAAIRRGPGPHPLAPADGLFQGCCPPSPERRRRLLGAERSLDRLTARHVATAFDLSRFSSACDLGGRTGTLAHALARAHPGLKVTVFDRPEVIAEATALHRDRGPTPRVSFAPGDLFLDPLPAADLYVLCRVLSSWPDEQARALLGRVSGCCRPGAGLLVAEAALEAEAEAEAEAAEEAAEAAAAAAAAAAARAGRLRALELLPRGGRERARAELARLLRARGFEVLSAARFAASGLDVLLARAPGPEGPPQAPPEGPPPADTPKPPPRAPNSPSRPDTPKPRPEGPPQAPPEGPPPADTPKPRPEGPQLPIPP